MVLAHLGEARTEAELVRLLAAYEFGTPASHVHRLSRLGYRVQYGPMEWDDLVQAMADDSHPIVFVDAQFLPWADFHGFHALVVDAIDADELALLDPASEIAPQLLAKDGFLIAWEEFDRRTAVIRRP